MVKNVKPGKYKVTLSCWIDKSTVTFEVLPQKSQVAKVPAGAPQTGGTEGPADHAGVLAAVAGGGRGRRDRVPSSCGPGVAIAIIS